MQDGDVVNQTSQCDREFDRKNKRTRSGELLDRMSQLVP